MFTVSIITGKIIKKQTKLKYVHKVAQGLNKIQNVCLVTVYGVADVFLGGSLS